MAGLPGNSRMPAPGAQRLAAVVVSVLVLLASEASTRLGKFSFVVPRAATPSSRGARARVARRSVPDGFSTLTGSNIEESNPEQKNFGEEDEEEEEREYDDGLSHLSDEDVATVTELGRQKAAVVAAGARLSDEVDQDLRMTYADDLQGFQDAKDGVLERQAVYRLQQFAESLPPRVTDAESVADNVKPALHNCYDIDRYHDLDANEKYRVRKQMEEVDRHLKEIEAGEFPVRKLHERIMLVTGAACGIGRATMRHLVEAGVTVIAVDVQEERLGREIQLISARNGKARIYGYGCDLDQMTNVAEFASNVSRVFPRIDAILHNAAAYDGRRWLWRNTVKKKPFTWEQNIGSIAVNTFAPFLLTLILLKPLLRAGKARVIFSCTREMPNTEKYYADLDCERRWSNMHAYRLSKLQLAMLAKELAVRYGDPKRITFHAIDPGMARTELIKTMVPIRYEKKQTLEEIHKEGLPLGALPDPEFQMASFEALTRDKYQETTDWELPHAPSIINNAKKRRKLWNLVCDRIGVEWPKSLDELDISSQTQGEPTKPQIKTENHPLVRTIEKFRSSREGSHAWDDFAEEKLDYVRDPKSHEDDRLLEFIDQHDLDIIPGEVEEVEPPLRPEEEMEQRRWTRKMVKERERFLWDEIDAATKVAKAIEEEIEDCRQEERDRRDETNDKMDELVTVKKKERRAKAPEERDAVLKELSQLDTAVGSLHWQRKKLLLKVRRLQAQKSEYVKKISLAKIALLPEELVGTLSNEADTPRNEWLGEGTILCKEVMDLFGPVARVRVPLLKDLLRNLSLKVGTRVTFNLKLSKENHVLDATNIRPAVEVHRDDKDWRCPSCGLLNKRALETQQRFCRGFECDHDIWQSLEERQTMSTELVKDGDHLYESWKPAWLLCPTFDECARQ